jgi:hypothetical protein
MCIQIYISYFSPGEYSKCFLVHTQDVFNNTILSNLDVKLGINLFFVIEYVDKLDEV